MPMIRELSALRRIGGVQDYGESRPTPPLCRALLPSECALDQGHCRSRGALLEVAVRREACRGPAGGRSILSRGRSARGRSPSTTLW
eukprot:scaffold168911_cov39-Tisochrysis_lutea.AAC.2